MNDERRLGMATDFVEQQVAGLYAFGSRLYELSAQINGAVANDWEPNLANMGGDVLKAATLVVRQGPVIGSISYGAYLADKRVAAEMAMNAAIDISTAAGQVFDLVKLLRSNIGDQVTASSDGDGYAEPAMSKTQADAIHDRALRNPAVLNDMTPLQVSAWWRRLSDGQKAEMLARQHRVIGNTNGIPFDVRMEANELNAQAYLRDNPQLGPGDEAYDYLKRVTSEFVDVSPRDGINDADRVRLIAFDPAADRIIEVVGDLGPDTRNIINYVPGTAADVNGFYTGETQRMAHRLVEGHPDRVAFVWKDATFPTFNPGATAVSGNVWAANVGSRYAAFNAALGVENVRDVPVMSIEHSFGSSVGGYAETSGSVFASRVVLGGAGMTEEWQPREGTEYVALVADGDILRNIHGRTSGDFDLGYAVPPDQEHGWREVDPEVERVAAKADPVSDVVERAIYEHRDVADPARSRKVVPTIDRQLDRDAQRAV